MAEIGTSLATGVKQVATAGTRVQLGSSVGTIEAVTVTVQALSTNTGAVVVGDQNVVAAVGTQGSPTQRGIRLTAGQSVSFALPDLSAVWVDAVTNGDGVSWTALLA